MINLQIDYVQSLSFGVGIVRHGGPYGRFLDFIAFPGPRMQPILDQVAGERIFNIQTLVMQG